jgi:hypothetical protein
MGDHGDEVCKKLAGQFFDKVKLGLEVAKRDFEGEGLVCDEPEVSYGSASLRIRAAGACGFLLYTVELQPETWRACRTAGRVDDEGRQAERVELGPLGWDVLKPALLSAVEIRCDLRRALDEYLATVYGGGRAPGRAGES